MAADLAQALQDALLHEIPLTAALGLRVEEASPLGVRLSLPLEPNHNHKHTAFGGSLYSAAVLAGWGVLWCALRARDLPGQVVVAASQERFLSAVDGTFSAVCAADPAPLDAALRVFQRRGLARAALTSTVECGGKVCVTFDGTYGLVRERPPG